jgi:hypothetical protein
MATTTTATEETKQLCSWCEKDNVEYHIDYYDGNEEGRTTTEHICLRCFEDYALREHVRIIKERLEDNIAKLEDRVAELESNKRTSSS